ncbi:hypothetical protein N7510_007516 [Penicillium lagena]|uniref:uncharacterized protein n=1 Tax=Penicillium lagena TaxID=94218 RepID=UPI002540958C|nr:uncharacterized protein N7510_007516 [Penicillium lagena]KAJ5610797.1 hypothetical protein N7510_007516 [Penicillium lagena]
MSLCPHHFRSRLTGLSLRCRRPGRWYRASPPKAACQVHDVAPDLESMIRDHALDEPILPPSSVLQHDPVSDLPNHPTQRRHARNALQRLLSEEDVSKIAEAEGLCRDPSVVSSTAYRLNGAIISNNRKLDQKSTHLAIKMRLNCIYQRQVTLTQWNSAYRELYIAKYYRRDVVKDLLPPLEEDGQELLDKLREGTFRETWAALPRAEMATHWKRLALWLLQNEPELALEFLQATTECQPMPDFPMVADCFLYLDRFYYERLKTWRKDEQTYRSLLQSCLDPNHWPILCVQQKGVRLYIRRANRKALNAAFQLTKERSIPLTPETALGFMFRYTELGDVDRALEAFEYVATKTKHTKFKLNSVPVIRHCCKLLTLDTVVDGEGGRNFRILPRLLEMGVEPDRDMMNVVLANAFKAGNRQLGSDMLQFMKDHGHKFDSYTYLTLLTEGVARGDRAHVELLIHEIESREDAIRENPYVASKILHAHYIFTAKNMDAESDRSRVFYSMLEMYNRLHDITPLKDLLIIPSHYQPPAGGANTPPSLMALYIMIATYFRCQRHISKVHQIYFQFRKLVAEGHEGIAPLAETDHTYNEFLIALRRHRGALRSCVRLVEDMLNPPPPSPTGRAIVHARPSMQTWTILLTAFTFNRQPHAAEKVREMMAKYGVKANDVTWNTIINGYANAQQIPETTRAIKEMERHGFAIDQYTIKSLRWVRDPDSLWDAMDAMDETAASAQPSESTEVNEGLDDDLLINSGLKRLEAKEKLTPKI